MGSYIGVYISKAVTLQEWQEVYEETLFLAKKLYLADEYHWAWKDGIDVCCLVPTKEIIKKYNDYKAI
jgi:hypothetical protein